MKLTCIFVITFWCTLYISEKSTAARIVNVDIQQSDDGSSDNDIEDISETNISGMEGKDKKIISEGANFVIQPEDERFHVFSEKYPEALSSDMQRKGKNKKPSYLRNCLDLKKQGKSSGTYLITPCDDAPSKLVNVYCDMDTDGGGWTVIQRRGNYPKQQDFFNSWYEYSIGFGSPSRDFWIGNDNIHCLTKQSHNEIRFDLEDWSGNTSFAKYDFFYIADQTNKYKLDVQNYTGNAGDSFFYHHNNQSFSTYDSDNDKWSSHCANNFKSGWWYNRCHSSHLNGVYNTSSWTGVVWYYWKGSSYSLKGTEMKIRPNND